MIDAIFWLLSSLIQLYIYAVIAAVVLSMLIAFGVINTRHPVVAQIADFLDRLTAPALNVIRRRLPNFGNIDISPIILILLLEASQIVLAELHLRIITSGLAF